MEDAGIHPSNEMYHDISAFSQKCCGHENAAVIKERLGMKIHVALRIVFPYVHMHVLYPFNRLCYLKRFILFS